MRDKMQMSISPDLYEKLTKRKFKNFEIYKEELEFLKNYKK